MVLKEQLIKDLEGMFGSQRVLKSELERYTYTYDSSFVSQQTEYFPDVVVCLESTEDVSKLMKYAWENEVPVTPRGAGSGQTGGSVPIKGGIVLDISGWKDIVEIDDVDRKSVV